MKSDWCGVYVPHQTNWVISDTPSVWCGWCRNLWNGVFFFFSGLFYFFCLGFQKRYRNWEKFVVDFYWFNWKNLYVKVDLDLYKTDVLLKLRTKVIKCAAIWFSDDEDLSEEGRSRNGKVSGIQEILKKRIGCLLGRETCWRSFQSFVLVGNWENCLNFNHINFSRMRMFEVQLSSEDREVRWGKNI